MTKEELVNDIDSSVRCAIAAELLPITDRALVMRNLMHAREQLVELKAILCVPSAIFQDAETTYTR